MNGIQYSCVFNIIFDKGGAMDVTFDIWNGNNLVDTFFVSELRANGAVVNDNGDCYGNMIQAVRATKARMLVKYGIEEKSIRLITMVD